VFVVYLTTVCITDYIASNYLVTLNNPVAARSKAWVCGRSLAWIVSSNPPEAWMSVSCECCVLSGRGLCVELITRPEEYCGVSEYDREVLIMRGPGPGVWGLLRHGGKNYKLISCLAYTICMRSPSLSSSFCNSIMWPVKSFSSMHFFFNIYLEFLIFSFLNEKRDVL
jgi:hypothetical protein